MKKTVVKALAVVGLLAIGGFVAFKMNQHKKDKSSLNNLTISDLKKKVPTEFSVIVDEAKSTGTKFWTDGKDFFKQLTGPTVKSKPETISEDEYLKAYSA